MNAGRDWHRRRAAPAGSAPEPRPGRSSGRRYAGGGTGNRGRCSGGRFARRARPLRRRLPLAGVVGEGVWVAGAALTISERTTDTPPTTTSSARPAFFDGGETRFHTLPV